MTVILKIHQAYRKIVSVCDTELLGKKFIEGNKQIDVDKVFYSGEEMDEKKALEIMKAEYYDDSTFSIVGKNSIALAIKAGIVTDKKEAIFKIQGIPYALGLI
jgi:hypothetical protein